MSIIRGDFVRPNNPDAGLPRGSVWRVICTAGALKLAAENDEARRYDHKATGRRFHNSNFDKVVLCRGQWEDARDAVCMRYPDSFYDDVVTGRMEGSCASPQNMPKPDAVTVAARDAEQATNTAAAVARMLESARKLEAERKAELREAKAAKAKADKEAAAKAKVEEGKRQLAARLHADRCLADATLALIAEVSHLNNGGAEQIAAASIAAHVGQLRPLAKSYGYRIAKPGVIAIVVKA